MRAESRFLRRHIAGAGMIPDSLELWTRMIIQLPVTFLGELSSVQLALAWESTRVALHRMVRLFAGA